MMIAFKKIERSVWINAVISIVAVFLSAFLAYYFAKNNEYETRAYLENRDALTKVLSDIQVYRNYYSVDWSFVSNQTISSETCHGYEKYDEQIKRNKILDECVYWNRIRGAQFLFHESTTEARILGSPKVLLALQEVESGFEEVFALFASQDYYSRSFIDSYNEVMPKKIDNLEKVFRSELKR